MRLLLVIFILSTLLLSILQFSGITDLKNPQLIRLTQSQLLEEYREKSADRFNRSIEKEPLGKILHRAADLFTTTLTLVSTRKSQPIYFKNRPARVIIHARFLVENSSEEPLEDERYMVFSLDLNDDWAYIGNTTRQDFYLNFLGID